jgi:hypothetical protein
VQGRRSDLRVKSVATCAACALSFAVTTLAATPARADPDRGAAVLVGAATFVLAFAAGGIVVATANGSNSQSNVGWVAIESGFTLAPLASHAVMGEWTRGLAFTAAPAAMLGGTVALFDYDNGTIQHGSLTEQRIMWGMFTAGLFAGIAGVVDAGLSRGPGRVALGPLVGPGATGLTLGGAL